MKRRGLLLIIAGFIAAVGAGLVVYSLTTAAANRLEPPPPATAVVIVQPTVTPMPVEVVVLAARDILSRQLVTAADVVTREFPVGIAPSDAFHSVSEVISRTATTNLLAGDVLVSRKFIDAGERTGASTVLPPGKVLVAFPATDMLNSTGAVQQGDFVDILLTIPVSGTTILPSAGAPAQQGEGARNLVAQGTMQNVEVYSMGIWTQYGPGAREGENGLKVITFVVDHQEALILKFVKDSGGSIDLIVRSAADKDNVATDPVSLDYLVDLYKFTILPAP